MTKRQDILKVLARLVEQAGGRAYLVGGSVRDELLGRPSKDFDVEIFGLPQEHLEDVLRRVKYSFDDVKLNLVGKSFAVYKLNDIDVSLPRRERKIGDGHKGFEIAPDSFMPEYEAAKRRDFTINSLMKNLHTGEILDFYGGQEDLKGMVIRHVDAKTFVEDSLRVFRAAQFAARFNFYIAEKTIELCRSVDLSDLPAERIYMEFEKGLLKPEYPGIFLSYLNILDVDKKLFPEIRVLQDTPQEYEWHPEGDVFVHTTMVMNEAAELRDDLSYPKQVTLMLAALCHDLGKAVVTQEMEGRIRAHGHSDAGLPLTESLLDKLNVHTIEGYDVRGQVLKLVKYHLVPGELFRTREKTNLSAAIKRLANKVDLDLLYRISKADSLGRGIPGVLEFDAEASEFFIKKARELKVDEKPEPAILMGRHLIELGFKPNPHFGVVLKEAYEKQLEGELKDLEEAKSFAVDKLYQLYLAEAKVKYDVQETESWLA